jgi:very-short-patch-repair endonuclease
MNDEFRSAERQYGLVTREQLLELGLSLNQIEYRIKTRRLDIAYPGVYRVVGSTLSFHQRAAGACLWLGTTSMVSHVSAGALYRLDGLATEELHLTVVGSVRRGRAHPSIIVHRASSLPNSDRRIVDGIPTTAPVRTLIDVAIGLDAEELLTAFESARRMGLLTSTQVTQLLHRLSHRPGAAAVRRMLAQIESRPLGSRLEVRLARLLGESSLPPSIAQYRVANYRVDWAWPGHRVAIEADGFRHHGQHLEWKRDRRRIAAIEALGWRIVHVTWDDVTKKSTQTLDRIALALGILAA